MATRRSARQNKGNRYKKLVSEGLLDILHKNEKEPVSAAPAIPVAPAIPAVPVIPKKPSKRKMAFYLKCAAQIPQLGEPGLQIDTPIYTDSEFDAALALLSLKRSLDMPMKRKQPESPSCEGDPGGSGDELPPGKKFKSDI